MDTREARLAMLGTLSASAYSQNKEQKMKRILSIILSLFSFGIFCQEEKEIAINNFETFFDLVHNSYPADQSTYSFKNYSELEKHYAFPEELELMMEYDTSKFYELYLFLIETKMDSLIKIEDLNLNEEVKNIYSQFKASILEGEQINQFNYQQDKIYSDSIKLILTNSEKPQIGYNQTVIMMGKSNKGRKKESEIYIEYNNSLEVILFGEVIKTEK